jgi:hypothetical protein
MIGKIYRDDMVILTIDGVPYTVRDDDPRYDELMDGLAEGWDEEAILDLLTSKTAVGVVEDQLSSAGIVFDMTGDRATYNGNPLPTDLTGYLSAAISRGDASAVVEFVKRLFKSPNENTRMSLFRFLETNHMPILDDGRFLAFKVVNDDYTDCHSGTFDNTPGSTLRVEWDQVDTNPELTCSRGLHVCSREYLKAFYHAGRRVVTVAVAPEDVGAVPYDYNGSKMRTVGYEVLVEITEKYVAEKEAIELSCRDAGSRACGLDWDDDDNHGEDWDRSPSWW